MIIIILRKIIIHIFIEIVPKFSILVNFQQYFEEIIAALGLNRTRNHDILTLLTEFHQAHHIASLAGALWT
jgi:hypothetical protein